ncbi:MAG: 1-acyl-sn-glycerol-3-phosphate acyltransferase [Myxococcales bacterium]|nr:1-acyl-sn-glycerol-3-phosphate acyltransferase [Myxococcales bacterium]
MKLKALRALSERPIRLPRLRPYVPQPDDPPIFWFDGERKDIVREVARRVTARHTADRRRMELVLNETALAEIRRLESQRDAEAAERLPFWRGLARSIARLDDAQKRDAVRDIVTRYAEDVAGNFDPRVYRLAKHAVPKLLTGVMAPSRLPEELATAVDGHTLIGELLQVEGDLHRLRHLEKVGTLVYVPTHSSNLDSVVIGRALEQVGLSPVIYGAGKNLFTNPMISFFMHNLGAYRVDRRVQARVYKEVLKVFSQVMIERGYHSLFFPGGTRSRSNLIESHLKLGLAGSALSAFAHNRVRGVDRPVWFVPTTINYELVLEGETLVEDWLKDEGKARYIIEDDEFSRLDRWIAFFRKIVGLKAACIIRFGDPIDCFGNPTDDEGRSLGPSGRSIDAGSYVERRGVPVEDAARDAAYTRELADVLVARFRQDTVLMATSLVAHVLFRRLVRETPGLDLFARLRVRGEVALPRTELAAEVGALRDRLVALQSEGVVRVSDTVRDAEPAALVDRALAVWNGYHQRVAARALDATITAEDPTLLLYYQNRLVPFANLLVTDEADRAAAQEIARIGGARPLLGTALAARSA